MRHLGQMRPKKYICLKTDSAVSMNVMRPWSLPRVGSASFF